MQYILKVYLKHKRFCFAEIECSKNVIANIQSQLNDDSKFITFENVTIQKESINYIIIFEKKVKKKSKVRSFK